MGSIFHTSFYDSDTFEFHLGDISGSTLRAIQARLEALEPSQAMEAAYKEAPTSPFLCILCMAAEYDTRYSRSAMVAMLVHHIVCGRCTYDVNSKRHWELPVNGLNAIVYAIRQKEAEDAEDAKIRQQLRSFYSIIVEIISKDLSFLRPAGPMANTRQDIVTVMLLSSMTFLGPKLYVSYSSASSFER
ncbi:hypothetical protein CPC08DRAFT_432928 [Agrocybe pediades]|nr:hypothetical protein CPC08DRAFT_432928 [Agrocybe pediades]